VDKAFLRKLIGDMITFMALSDLSEIESKVFGIVLGIIQRRLNTHGSLEQR